MLLNWFYTPCSIEIEIDNDQTRKSGSLYRTKAEPKCLIFTDGEELCGTVNIHVKPGKQLEHNGITVEFIGQIELLGDRSLTTNFFVISKDLEGAGVLMGTGTYPWKFASVDKSYETYWGVNVKLRYFVRATVARSYAGTLSVENDIIVQNINQMPTVDLPLKMEVGIVDCLHIEFEYDKSNLCLTDVVCGKVHFLLVRIKIKHMELEVIRTETTIVGRVMHPESEVIQKFELMDGTPTKSECIPVRMYLSGADLTPTYNNVLGKFSVKYHLNLVLVDEEDRRYFKKQEVQFWRTTVE